MEFQSTDKAVQYLLSSVDFAATELDVHDNDECRHKVGKDFDLARKFQAMLRTSHKN
jgi:hypothetical protein